MIKKIGEMLEFPSEANEYFEETLKIICRDFELMDKLSLAMDNLFCGGDKYSEMLEDISKKSHINRYTADMIFLLLASKPLFYIYKQNGLPEELYRAAMMDLKYKLIECKSVYGVWGTNSIAWFAWYYTLNRFALGRLQYEKFTFKKGTGKYDNVMRLGETVYPCHIPEGYRGIKFGSALFNCHIPSSGSLKEEDVLESFKTAYKFYKIDGIMTIVCNSWLLYPPHYTLYPEGSNLRKFCDLFDVIWQGADEGNPDMWRIFNRMTEDYESLPEDTSLRKAFKRFFSEGNKMGCGYGVILFDGEKIIKKAESGELGIRN